jgi:beta-glucanase (GH16 family)
MKLYRALLLLLPLSLTLIACWEGDKSDGLPTTAIPTLALVGDDIVMPEGDSDTTLTFTVRLEGLNLMNVVVNYATFDGTARAGEDFVGITDGKLLFPPAVTERTIQVTIRGDLIKEPDEFFELRIFDATNAEIIKDRIMITLLNDDINPADFVNIPAGGYTSPETYDGYTLVWSDEFEGEGLDAANWTHELGDGCPGLCGWGNNELQWYQPDNTLFRDGYLIIQARQESVGGRDFTASRFITKGKQEFQYGRIDIRAALPEGRGLWPALWMLGANIDQVSWPACGEIDIMELTGDRPNRIIGTAHFGATVAQHQFRTAAKFLPAGQKFSEAFHVFSIIWEEDRIEWYLDDELYHTFTPANTAGQPYPFNQPFFFIFNVAVGGNLPGSPDANTRFPQHMIVDYIRVFQR